MRPDGLAASDPSSPPLARDQTSFSEAGAVLPHMSDTGPEPNRQQLQVCVSCSVHLRHQEPDPPAGGCVHLTRGPCTAQDPDAKECPVGLRSRWCSRLRRRRQGRCSAPCSTMQKLTNMTITPDDPCPGSQGWSCRRPRPAAAAPFLFTAEPGVPTLSSLEAKR